MKFLKTFLACLAAMVAGFFLLIVVWIVMIAGMAGSMNASSEVVTNNTILKIDMSEMVIDAPSEDPFAGINLMSMQATPQLTLLSALRAIEGAAEDDRIKGIYMRLNGMGGFEHTAVVEELREALVQFKESGKFIIAYNESYSQGGYYLASVADEIYIQPEGSFDWSGLSQRVIFYKGLMDKLDIQVEIFRPTVCKYKSAVEPYFLKKMSPENRAQMQALVDSMWGTIIEAISASRGISVEELNAMADNLDVILAEEAVEAKLVDGIKYEDEIETLFEEKGVERGFDNEINYVTLGGYAAQVTGDVKKASTPEVALVYANGQILDGEGTGAIYGNTLAAKLREVRLDENVKSVVVRVNSPGGSALASDVIWREMELLKAEKPVIVSMGGYAASGGYYISAPADAILADKLTLTGSIGVFGMVPYTAKALESKLGVTMDEVKTNKFSGMGGVKPLSATERAAMMRGVDRVYERFTGLVSEGRNLPIERVLEIAGGRVWSGEDALEIGLIDSYGGLKAAVAVAVDKAGLGEDYKLVERLEAPTGLAAYFSAFSANMKASWEASELGVLLKEYRQIQQDLSQRGVVMYSPCRMEIE
ncbi:MAG: signal peptide peptidase SppA [Rikenellaceae bacterium]|nr:signal peptide peptidase SppA [Rikenellaceae bacterium]